jgi:hypothetical protein
VCSVATNWVDGCLRLSRETPQYPSWVATEETLVGVARLLREFHCAMDGFGDGIGVEWPTIAPPAYQGSAICHMDVSMANVVRQPDGSLALIDFEEVGRAERIWDVARTVRHWVPLIDPHDLPDSLEELNGQQSDRLAMFARAYGLSCEDQTRLVDAVLDNCDSTYENMRRGAERGHVGLMREWSEGAAARNRRGRQWIGRHRGELQAGLA